MTTTIQSGFGIELGRFRLKPGVSNATLCLAHARMVTDHLSLQTGWVGQHLVDIGDGRFIDLAIAVDQIHAETICQSWTGQPACAAFLELIEPEDMTFGTLV